MSDFPEQQAAETPETPEIPPLGPPKKIPPGAVDEAMTLAKGNQLFASEILGITMQQLRAYIYCRPPLRAKWRKPRYDKVKRKRELIPPPTESQTFSRDGLTEEMAMQMSHENRGFRRGLEKMGLKPSEIELAAGFQEFGSRQFKEAVEIMMAGVTPLSIKFHMAIADLCSRLKVVQTKIGGMDTMSDDRVKWVAEEKHLISSLSLLGTQLVNIFKEAHRGQMLMALVKFRNAAAGMKPGKPRFGMVQRVTANGEAPEQP